MKMVNPKLCHIVFNTPLATLGVCTENQSIIAVHFFSSAYPERINDADAETIANEFKQYFANPTYRFRVSAQLRGSEFRQRVWQQLRAIPLGQSKTYGEIAGLLNTSARAVGGACRHNPVPIIVPCHRVLAQNGLGGFAGNTSGFYSEIKQWLLKHEGVIDG